VQSAPGGASLSALKEGKSKSEQMSIHEIRNPIAAMRLKAENAMAAGNEDRRISAPQSILQQIGRLDGLLRDLLAMTQRRLLCAWAFDVERCLPSGSKTLHIGLDAGGGLLVCCRTGEK
jgi:signal transduction histidine kinase